MKFGILLFFLVFYEFWKAGILKKFHPLFDDSCFNHVFSKEEFIIDFINAFFNTKYRHEDVLLKSEDVLPETEYNEWQTRKNQKISYANELIDL